MKTLIIILSLLAVSGLGTLAEARPYFRYHHRHFYGPGVVYDGPVYSAVPPLAYDVVPPPVYYGVPRPFHHYRFRR